MGFDLRSETSHLSLKMIALANVNCRNGRRGAKVVTEAGRPAGGYWEEMIVTWTWDSTGRISCWSQDVMRRSM